MTKLANTNPFPLSRMHCESIPPPNPALYFFADSEKNTEHSNDFFFTVVAIFLADTVQYRYALVKEFPKLDLGP
jgi:hypothetical protein